LRKMGWRVITLWSCKKISAQSLAARLRRVGVKTSALRQKAV
jgi:G:T-mismatch repair DNA endonuclease (very short patch repair protein)